MSTDTENGKGYKRKKTAKTVVHVDQAATTSMATNDGTHQDDVVDKLEKVIAGQTGNMCNAVVVYKEEPTPIKDERNLPWPAGEYTPDKPTFNEAQAALVIGAISKGVFVCGGEKLCCGDEKLSLKGFMDRHSNITSAACRTLDAFLKQFRAMFPEIQGKLEITIPVDFKQPPKGRNENS